MTHTIKFQLQLRQPQKTISILIFCLLCFSGLTIYMSSPINIFFSNETMDYISYKLSLSYLSLLALSGPMVFLAFNGFIEDKSIFMSLLARKVNIFYFVISKVIASLIYIVFSIPIALLINYLYLQSSLIDIALLVSSELMVFYIMYFLIYMINGEKHFDLLMTYALIIVSIILTFINPYLCFLITSFLFFGSLVLMYFKTNSFISYSLFKTKETLFDKIIHYIVCFIDIFISKISYLISFVISDSQFIALFSKDLYSLFSFIPKLLLLHIILIFVAPQYQTLTLLLNQFIIISFLKKVYTADIILLDLQLITYSHYFLIKSIILIIFNLIIQMSFMYSSGQNIFNILISSGIITISIAISLIYKKYFIYQNI